MKIQKNSIYFLFIFYLLFSSCTQNTPKLESTRKAVIFEYETFESLPDVRFSFFIESDKNIRRVEKIILTNIQTGYVWQLDDLVLYESVDRYYCGNTNIQSAYGEKIPNGFYSANYIQYDGQEKKISVSLNYDENLYSKNANEVLQLYKDSISSTKIAIYDKSGVLIHYGEKDSKFDTVRDVWNEYNDAQYFYEVIFLKKNDVILILPRQNVELEKSINDD